MRCSHPGTGTGDVDPARSRHPATLAHLLVSKYCDHLPLYRQSEIFAIRKPASVNVVAA
jgi:hypothetical protein